MRRATRILLACLLCATPAAAQTAPARRVMTVDDYFQLRQVSDPQIAPDGSAVVYVVSVADIERGRWDTDLWRVRPGASPERLTFNPGRDSAPRWSPDGKTIAFLRAQPDAGQSSAQIFLLAADGGEARELTREPSGVNSFAWSRDAKSIFYLAAERPEGAAPREAARRPEPQFEDEGRSRARLWRIELATGRRSRIETGDWHVRDFELAPDGNSIIFSASPSSYFNDAPNSELFLLSLATPGEPRRLTQNDWSESGVAWRLDEKGFLFLADADPRWTRRALQTAIFYLDLATGAVRHIRPREAGADYPGPVEQAEWLDAQMLLVAAGRGTNQRLYRLNFSSGELEALTQGAEVSGNFSRADAGGRIAFTRQSPERPADVWLLEPGAAPRPLTDHNPQIRELTLSKHEVVRWRASDGVEVEGILLTPAEGKTPWPMVTRIHGGPASADMSSFQSAAYVLAGAGFAVLLPNYRGSTNYKLEFAERSIGDRNGRDALDIEEGVDALVARSIADKNRLGVGGWSAGGVLTNWLVGRSTRFRAASSGAGVSDWTMQYFLSDYTFGSELYFRGTPWEKHELYWERSPLRLAAQVKTPVLIHCGANDERVPIHHSRAWFRALREHGVETRFLVYPGEPHGFQQPANQRRRMEEDLAWYKKYLLAP